MHHILKRFLFFACVIVLLPASSFANEEKESFSVGEMIMEHITDAHDWHILSYAGKDVSLPLPIILLHENKLHVFMSSKFHHGKEAYKGFKLETTGDQKGKIICIDENGVPTGLSPWDLSITKNVLALFFSAALIVFILARATKSYSRRKGKAPRGLQSLIEMLVIFIRDDVARSAIGEKKYEKYMPFLLTLFFFILINNLLGLVPILPGGANVTGNIAVTGVLALFTFFFTLFSGNRHYWVDLVNAEGVPWWLKFPIPLMPIVEILSVFTKPFVLMVRLFANITAGHIIILGFISIIFIFGEISAGSGLSISVVSILFSVFMSLLELLVAFIQAYVFVLLSALYIGMAVHEPEKKHSH